MDISFSLTHESISDNDDSEMQCIISIFCDEDINDESALNEYNSMNHIENILNIIEEMDEMLFLNRIILSTLFRESYRNLFNYTSEISLSPEYYNNLQHYLTSSRNFQDIIDDSMNVSVEQKGLPIELIAALPERLALDSDDVCAICTDNYKENELITVLPCNHSYHKTCIKIWLKSNANCPICREDLAY